MREVSSLSIIALRLAPVPSPITTKSGVEWYSSPPSWILTLVNLPSEIIGTIDGVIFLPGLDNPFLTKKSVGKLEKTDTSDNFSLTKTFNLSISTYWSTLF